MRRGGGQDEMGWGRGPGGVRRGWVRKDRLRRAFATAARRAPSALAEPCPCLGPPAWALSRSRPCLSLYSGPCVTSLSQRMAVLSHEPVTSWRAPARATVVTGPLCSPAPPYVASVARVYSRPPTWISQLCAVFEQVREDEDVERTRRLTRTAVAAAVATSSASPSSASASTLPFSCSARPLV